MYAIVKSGARQYRASIGDTLVVERIPVEEGQTVELDQVLLVADGDVVQVGRPSLEGARVVATVVGQEKGPKIRVFKYRPKQRYRRRAGHRQRYTRLQVDEILV